MPRHWFPSRVQTHDARSVLIGSENPPKHIPHGFDTGRAHRSNGLICRHRYGAGRGRKRSLAMHTWSCKFLEVNAWSAWSTRCLTYNLQRACNFDNAGHNPRTPLCTNIILGAPQTVRTNEAPKCMQNEALPRTFANASEAGKRDMLIVLPSPLLSIRLLKHIALVAFRPE